MGTVDSVKQQKGGFKKVLGLGSLVVFGLAYLAPTAVFNYYGPISVAAKGMYPTCYLITTLAMFLLHLAMLRWPEKSQRRDQPMHMRNRLYIRIWDL